MTCYFHSESKGVAFLETDVGVAYTPVFRTLRLRNILTDNASLCILESDGIVPRGKPHLLAIMPLVIKYLHILVIICHTHFIN